MGKTLGVTAAIAAALVAPFATLLAIGGVLPALAVAIAAWSVYAACWLSAGRIWTDVDAVRARGALLGGTVLSVLAFLVGFFGNYWFSIDHELCGGGASPWIAIVIAVVAYLVAGSVLLRVASRLLWLWPLLVVAAWAFAIAARAALPGGHGFCET